MLPSRRLVRAAADDDFVIIFKFLVNNLLESHAPMKEKHIRRKQAPFMNKSV